MEKVASHKDEFIQANSPDGGFLQSEEWRKFQESFGRKTFSISKNNFHANIVEHELPIVGKYFYIPKGPVIPAPAFARINSGGSQSLDSSRSLPRHLAGLGMTEVINLAKKENIGWIRFDANNSHILDLARKNWRVVKAPHDMQPRELFIIDITKPEEELLAGMKVKTRYNIKVAKKHNVKIHSTNNQQPTTNNRLEDFLRLVRITAKRDRITPHSDEYYRKMFETIPAENLKLYIAEYDGKVVAANINIFFGKTATYLHGASDHNYKNIMAPYLLQWQAMLDTKAAGCNFYDLGGVKILKPGTQNSEPNGWEGITKFKTGFSVTTESTKFTGSYDIVINPFRYSLYRILQRIKSLF